MHINTEASVFVLVVDHGALDGRTMACIESALTSKANACLVCLEVIKKIEPVGISS